MLSKLLPSQDFLLKIEVFLLRHFSVKNEQLTFKNVQNKKLSKDWSPKTRKGSELKVIFS